MRNRISWLMFMFVFMSMCFVGTKTLCAAVGDKMEIDFAMVYGADSQDNAKLNQKAYLKVTGAYGTISSKPDARTGASSPEGATDALNKYRYVGGASANGTMLPGGIRGILLYGVSPASTYKFDGLSGSGSAQKIVGTTNGPTVRGVGIQKASSGVITIRYVHAGGTRVAPTAYELKSDANGIFKFGKGSIHRVSEAAIERNVNFTGVRMKSDLPTDGKPYWEGDLQGTFENGVLTLKGTLTERQ